MYKLDPKYSKRNVLEFVQHSNFIESEYSAVGLKDALKAWKYLEGIKTISKEQWLPTILETHRILMDRLWPEIAGKLRVVDVRVGSSICPPWEKVPELLARWVDNFSDPKTDGETIESHIQFEKVHPHRDGNGRVGRHILNWQRMRLGLPLFVIHLGKEQYDYYDMFRHYESEN